MSSSQEKRAILPARKRLHSETFAARRGDGMRIERT
jgi:hypothetical protein